MQKKTFSLSIKDRDQSPRFSEKKKGIMNYSKMICPFFDDNKSEDPIQIKTKKPLSANPYGIGPIKTDHQNQIMRYPLTSRQHFQVIPSQVYNTFVPVKIHKIPHLHRIDYIYVNRNDAPPINNIREKRYSEQRINSAIRREEKYKQVMNKTMTLLDQRGDKGVEYNNYTKRKKQEVIYGDNSVVSISEYQNCKLQLEKWKELYRKLQNMYNLSKNSARSTQNEFNTTDCQGSLLNPKNTVVSQFQIQDHSKMSQILKQNKQIVQKINILQNKIQLLYSKFEQTIGQANLNSINSLDKVMNEFRKNQKVEFIDDQSGHRQKQAGDNQPNKNH